MHNANDWQKIFEEQTSGVTSAADRILGILRGYNHASRCRAQDAEELAEALVGWRRYMVARCRTDGAPAVVVQAISYFAIKSSAALITLAAEIIPA